jgi:hypothetical protein
LTEYRQLSTQNGESEREREREREESRFPRLDGAGGSEIHTISPPYEEDSWTMEERGMRESMIPRNEYKT